MNSKDHWILLPWLLKLQFRVASAEDRALRGRNPSADLEPDRRQAGPPSGGPAALPESEKKAKNPPREYPNLRFLARHSNETKTLLVNKNTQPKMKKTRTSVSAFSGKVQFMRVLTGLRLKHHRVCPPLAGQAQAKPV